MSIAHSSAGLTEVAAALHLLTDRLYRARTISEVYEAALDAIIGTLGCHRASILLFDDQNVMRFVGWRGLSDGYRQALEGHTPWQPGAVDPEPIFVTDIETTNEPDAIKSRIKAEGIRALGFVPLTIQGAVVGKFMTYYNHARHFHAQDVETAVTIARQVGFALERSRADAARQLAESGQRESEDRLQVMSELAPVMLWISDATGACLHLNRELRTFWGVDENAFEAFDWSRTMHPDDAPRIGQTMMTALAERKSVSLKGRYLSAIHGDYRTLETQARPRFSSDGEFLGMIGVNIDITDHERAETQRNLLVAELNHRVKNTLAVVQSIAHQTFKIGSKNDTSIGDAKRAFEGRLLALSRAHDLLTQESWHSLPLGDLAADLVTPRGANRQRVLLAGPPVRLPPRHAVAVAMVLHELSTNAIKYGALSNEDGRIDLQWRVDGEQLVIDWTEQAGPPVTPPTRRGFGSVMIERTLGDLDGTVARDFPPSGATCRLVLALPALASPSESLELIRAHAGVTQH